MAQEFNYRQDGTQASKKNIGATWPQNAFDAAPGLDRIEPFLTASKFKKRFLFGVPLKSPVTKEEITNSDIKDYITRAGNLFELDSKVDIFPVVRRWRLPFDPNLYHQFIYLEVPVKPVQQVFNLAITSASYSLTPGENQRYPRGAEIYTIPNEWVEMGNALRGIVNVNPINPAFSAIGTNAGVAASGATILQFIGQQGWVPAYWNIEVLCGMGSKEGNVPFMVNEAVGLRAVMLVLDNVIPQYRIASQSLNIDGQGQSVSNQMYALLQDKRDQAEKNYNIIVGKIKTLTSSKFFSSNV
jgi:hypothetical protein